MRFFAFLLLLVASPAFAQESPLVGNWKLVASQIILDNEPPMESPMYGARPRGVLILTREGAWPESYGRNSQSRDGRRGAGGTSQDDASLQRQVPRRRQGIRDHR